MRRTFLILGCAAVIGLLSGCATSYPVGAIFTEVGLPAGVTSQASYSKVGRSQCESIQVWSRSAMPQSSKPAKWQHRRIITLTGRRATSLASSASMNVLSTATEAD